MTAPSPGPEPTIRPSQRSRWRRSPLRIARALLVSQYALMLEFRAEIVLWALSGVMPLLMYAVWSGAPAGVAAGLNAQQFARYFLAALVARQFTVVWVIYAFEEDNLLGRLSPLLLQPLPLFWRYWAAHLAEQATRAPLVAVMVLLFVAAVPAAAPTADPLRLLLALVAIHLGFCLNFLLQYAITMLCFWSERASALERLLAIPQLFLSGLLAPLDLFPEQLRAAVLHTPFPAIIYLPAQLAAGGPIAIGPAFLNLFGWLALLLPLNLLLWRAGMRRFAALGA
jgi:ABC-2 type transport system permease protein